MTPKTAIDAEINDRGICAQEKSPIMYLSENMSVKIATFFITDLNRPDADLYSLFSVWIGT
jgi:hypothetical protein